jgi:hypothetical protein
MKLLIVAIALALYAAGFWTAQEMRQVKVEVICKSPAAQHGTSI